MNKGTLLRIGAVLVGFLMLAQLLDAKNGRPVDTTDTAAEAPATSSVQATYVEANDESGPWVSADGKPDVWDPNGDATSDARETSGDSIFYTFDKNDDGKPD